MNEPVFVPLEEGESFVMIEAGLESLKGTVVENKIFGSSESILL